jgi:hypothetical protein
MCNSVAENREGRNLEVNFNSPQAPRFFKIGTFIEMIIDSYVVVRN